MTQKRLIWGGWWGMLIKAARMVVLWCDRGWARFVGTAAGPVVHLIYNGSNHN
jgi:hypothetical protein